MMGEAYVKTTLSLKSARTNCSSFMQALYVTGRLIHSLRVNIKTVCMYEHTALGNQLRNRFQIWQADSLFHVQIKYKYILGFFYLIQFINVFKVGEIHITMY